MTWEARREGIRQAVAQALGLDADSQTVRYMNQAGAGAWRSDPHVDLVLRSPRAMGTDETRRRYLAGPEAVETSLVGFREFTLSVRIEAESQADGAEAVGTLAGRLRLRLRSAGVRAILRGVDVALVRAEPTVEADFEADGRMVSLAVTDLILSAKDAEVDQSAATDWIETVTGTGLGRDYSVTAPEE